MAVLYAVPAPRAQRYAEDVLPRKYKIRLIPVRLPTPARLYFCFTSLFRIVTRNNGFHVPWKLYGIKQKRRKECLSAVSVFTKYALQVDYLAIRCGCGFHNRLTHGRVRVH